MIAWMLYSAVVALVVAAAARAAEWLTRLAGHSVRWVWAGALVLTLFLSASAALRGRASGALPAAGQLRVDLGQAAKLHAAPSWRGALSARIEDLRHLLDAPVRSAAAIVHRAISPAANLYAVCVALALSAAVILVLVGVARRFRRARRGWPVAAMHGVRVRVAPRVGPVVIGFTRPEIVVPRWLLARPPGEQRLVVNHEDEHVRARDPLLVGLAWGAVAVAPWNPAVWFMLSRLRLAVELDCDARVLRRGAAPRSYGSLLIDVAQHASPLRLSALALADDSSHLHQRILAMKPRVPRYARLRGGLAAAFALAGVLVACQATLPTDAEIERMDVETATRTAHELASARHADTTLAYTIDGTAATMSQARALVSAVLAKVQIVPGAGGEPTQINIETRKPASMTVTGDSGRIRRVALMKDGGAGPAETVGPPTALTKNDKAPFTGLIFIDGVRATESEMMSLDRNQIESVEILKGAAAAQEYADPDASKGVITIKTKHARPE